MLYALIDNIFVLFSERVFKKAINIPMGTKCALLLTDLLQHASGADFLQGFLKNKEFTQTFNSSFR